jgi:Replication-relaxation
VLRLLLWRLLGLLALLGGFMVLAWLLDGGIGHALRGDVTVPSSTPHPRRDQGPGHAIPDGAATQLTLLWRAGSGEVIRATPLLTIAGGLGLALVAAVRWRARRRRRYVRMRIDAYRGDSTGADAIAAMYEALHKRLLRRWWRRVLTGQPSLALEVHHAPSSQGAKRSAFLAVSCPVGLEAMVESALQVAYPNCRLDPHTPVDMGTPAIVRLEKQAAFIKRVKVLDRFEHERDPPMNALMTAMGACGERAFVQVAMTPAPVSFERLAKRLFKRHEAHLARERREHLFVRDRSLVEEAELRGGLQVQHRPLFFVDLRVVGPERRTCERIASQLRAAGAENRLVERGTAVRHGLLGSYRRRVARGEGNPLPSVLKGVYGPTELAAIWHLPSIAYMTVPWARSPLPIAPAPPGIMRPPGGSGTLHDALGPVCIHEQLRKQNTAVPGTVEQGKSSYLVATVAEDLRRKRCAIVVLDPKGDAAEAALSAVAPERVCTLLDLAHPTCGFNPLAVDAPADVIADYVVAALKNLFTDADIRASSDRYLRNAIIAVLAYDRRATLWDAARLLSVGEEGYTYRRRVGAHVRTLPEMKEISAFFTAELTAQLADARSTTTAKLDAPVNKLARLLNSPSIKRVLLNRSLRLDFDRIIAAAEVLVVKGALGAMGAGNTSVVMQLLVGMLDAALARQQDLVAAERRVAVALKVDEAPLVINRGFAETMALKRSAGLETVACWQADAQWTDPDVRAQLDALFAHRVYFATASARDARESVRLTMAEFSDTVRPGMGSLAALGHPDVRMRLPKYHAIASWTTPAGRQPPFIAQTLPLRVDRERLALHASRQHARGARHLADLRQPHWDHRGTPAAGQAAGTQIAAGRDGERAAASDDRSRRDRRDDVVHAEPLPAQAAESFRELAELDGAHSVRWARASGPRRSLHPEALDVDVLRLIGTLGHVLTTQIHRRFNPDRALTTTQRRLKRLSDTGLVERFQFHRRDGGGVPMCYVLAGRGAALLDAHGQPAEGTDHGLPQGVVGSPARSASQLRQARHDAHVAGWALALERAVGEGALAIRGAGEATLSPPLRSGGGEKGAIGPLDLRLPGGRTPHDFLRPQDGHGGGEAERFETVRPDAIVEVPASALVGRGRDAGAPMSSRARVGDRDRTEDGADRALDVMIELDDRLPRGRAVGKLARYDHFLAGWSVHVARYGPRLEATALVVFVCRDRARARECARLADPVLRACRAYAGEYPFDWEYPGREGIVFVSERDVHEGVLSGYGVPRLPPAVRVTAAHGDPLAGEAVAELFRLLEPRSPRRG